MKNQSNQLKYKAKNAKKRLITGYWDIVKQRKEIALTITEGEVLDKVAIGSYCRTAYGADAATAGQLAKIMEDEHLYKKVADFLRSDAVISNPIGLLIDKDKLDSLDERGKSYYVLKMSQKYRELCNRYYSENG